MGRSRCCYVPKCKTGYKSKYDRQKDEKISLFKARNMDQLEKWHVAIRRADRKITFNDAVCSLHFTEDDIDQYYETLLPDGTLWKMKKGSPKIKSDAIPSIFPNYPSYLNKVSKKRKPLAQHDTIEKKIKLEPIASTRINENDEAFSFSTLVSENDEAFSFSTLVSNLVSLSKPSVLWGITAHETFVICAKWSKDHVLEKRVTIDCDLKVEVFLKDRKVNFPKEMITSIVDLSSILEKVDKYVICLGVGDVEKTECGLYLPPHSRSQYCESCRKIRNKEVNRSRKKELYMAKRDVRRLTNCMEKFDVLIEEIII